jgi:hypothetical protein
MHPSKLYVVSVCYSVVPFFYTRHPKKYNPPPPPNRSFAVPCGKINIIERKPRENCCLGKYPLKYTTDNIVQQSNCRWHCEHSCLLG